MTPPLIYLLIKLVYNGLLTLAIRFTDSAPLGRGFSGRWLGFAILAGAALLAPDALPAVSAHPPQAAAPATLPAGPGERVALLGIDGMLPDEIDYLIALGELPELARMAREGRVFRYHRKESPRPRSGPRWPPACRGRPTASPRSTASGRWA